MATIKFTAISYNHVSLLGVPTQAVDNADPMN